MSGLQIRASIGFSGHVPEAVVVHPDRETLMYPLSCTLVLEGIKDKSQNFLMGHTDDISAVAVSSSGRYIATGQETKPGHQADIIVWDYATLKELHRFKLHKDRIEALAFSCNDGYLASLGGEDDGTMVVWDLEAGKAVCGAQTSTKATGAARALAFSNQSETTLVTAGTYTLRTWSVNLETRKLQPTDCQLRSLRRIVNCVAISHDQDEAIYCGTSTGDIVQVNLRTGLLKSSGPKGGNFGRGINSIQCLRNGEILIGAGDGTVAVVDPTSWRVLRKTQFEGAVTSVALRGDGHELFVGTDKSNIYRTLHANLESELRSACHHAPVVDVAFPAGTSALFASCSGSEIRVWQTSNAKELLRIDVPGKNCLCIAFPLDGKAILSGWDDGVIRAFTPESGKLKFEINNAHNKGACSLAITSDGRTLISGGGDGVVRVWKLGNQSQTLHVTTKEHKSKISCLLINKSDTEFVSSSADGSCLVWNLERCVRSQILSASTLFTAIKYRPDEAQIVSVGSDRKLGYWEVYDGSLIREVEVSYAGTVNSVDVSPDGALCLTAGQDQLVKVIDYNEGDVVCTGIGHSQAINTAKFGPDMQCIVTVGNDGAIFVWDLPRSD